MKIVAIVQARMGSSRLPGKVMADIAGKPAIERLLGRLAASREVQEIWLACSENTENDRLAELVRSLGYPVFRGSETDVLSRFVEIARTSQADGIVRITGDCPLVDSAVVDTVVSAFRASNADFVSNTLTRTFPDGLDVEVFTACALFQADRESQLPFLREHVTPYIHGRLAPRLPCGSFVREQVTNPADFSHLRWTLDEPEDLKFLRAIFTRLPDVCSWQDVLALCTREPNLLRINNRIRHNEGTSLGISSEMRSFSNSNAFFERAAVTIPLASQTFSKSHQQWVKGATPLFIDRGRGSRIWDIDDNSYIDYVLGLLPIILGYCDEDVDHAIKEQLDKGIVFPLPSVLEAEVAERLVEHIPCAEMVRFGKNGSDATTAAIRLARACTGRSKIAMAGYHGWHDWYIGTTTRNLGVPDDVRKLSISFMYNDADSLASVLREDPTGFAAIILEPAGATSPEPGFLEAVRGIADKYGIILIFDEIICGFRINMGGAQAEYGVVPDLACFGKAMANGMPISAVVGRRDLMSKMEDIFFSGTFGGEALSLAACMATIDKLHRENGINRMRDLGRRLISRVRSTLAKTGMQDVVDITDCDWWPRFSITHPPVKTNLVTSLMRQEFIQNGLMMGASLNLCLSHDVPSIETATVEAIESAFSAVRDHLDSPDPGKRLRGDLVQPTFAVRP